jgi:hypothetical protein
VEREFGVESESSSCRCRWRLTIDAEEREMMERMVRATEANKPLSAVRGIVIILMGVLVISSLLFYFGG